MVGDIILIGPYGAGKTEIAKLLAERLNLTRCALDDAAYRFYEEVPSFKTEEATLGDIDDPRLQPYSAYAVKRFLQAHAHEHCIMDFGAQHIALDGNLFTEIEQILASYCVVLLMPSPDKAESMRILQERHDRDEYKQIFVPHARMNKYFINHPAYYALAKHIVYTKDKTEQETCDEILCLYLH
jgi:adenylate kinase family enzyme